jgi:dTDP-4-dehydrorhamnose 3,5-epimerase
LKFTALTIAGAYVIDLEPRLDERGFFARAWDSHALTSRGLDGRIVECSISYNRRKGTLRGMHYQAPPYEETKVVRCVRGAVFDVILDLRRTSLTYKKWTANELSADNRLALYIPKGCAHGFQTLTADAELFYQISDCYEPVAARGVRWNDPAFGIEWPDDERTISDRDRSYEDCKE